MCVKQSYCVDNLTIVGKGKQWKEKYCCVCGNHGNSTQGKDEPYTHTELGLDMCNSIFYSYNKN